MADNITIIIRAVDEASKQLQLVNKQLEGMDKTFKQSTKTQVQATDAFKDANTQLLALGNVARGVDNIFISYTSLELRLENAQLRVIDAQEDLNRVLTEGKAGTEEHENAVRRLTISQNNLERANNQVIGTYISMSIQMGQVIGSLPTL